MNGTGKTTILEAIFILGFGKSFLNVKKSTLVNYEKDEFSIELISKTSHSQNKISAFYHKKKQQNFFLLLNEKRTNIFKINNSNYLYPVFFSSSNYNLYIESKPHARKMIDRFIFGVDTLYIHYILSYNKALKQKNQLLKMRGNTTEVSSWNKIISEAAVKVVNKRMLFIDRLNAEIENRYGSALSIKYDPSFSIGKSKEISKEAFFMELEKMRNIEVKYSRSLKGPHLDDFTMNVNSKNLKYHSSGEKKINLLMIYISFIELFKKMRNEYPVFLVDDYDTAIDEKNIAFLIDNYPDLQLIATSVNRNSGFDQLIELRKEN